jgi:hypothetical protein
MHSDANPELWIPSDAEEAAKMDVDWDELARKDVYNYDPDWDDENDCKWKAVRQPKIPEPIFEHVEYAPHESKRLAKRFAESGLQVIVKMASVELTPDKPEFPPGGWHVSITCLRLS